jgi:hypothetical protein
MTASRRFVASFLDEACPWATLNGVITVSGALTRPKRYRPIPDSL